MSGNDIRRRYAELMEWYQGELRAAGRLADRIYRDGTPEEVTQLTLWRCRLLRCLIQAGKRLDTRERMGLDRYPGWLWV